MIFISVEQLFSHSVIQQLNIFKCEVFIVINIYSELNMIRFWLIKQRHLEQLIEKAD